MPRRKPKHTLLSAGASLISLGLIFLLLPAMLGTRPVMNAIGEGLRMPGWFALGVGVALLALHWLVRQRSAVTVKWPKVDRRNTPHRVSQIISQVEPTLEPPARIADSPDATPAPAPARAHERLMRWSPEVFAAIEWRRFEAVVEALFGQAGFETRAQTHGADGGGDVWLHSRHAGGAPVGVVQCKHWQGKPVPVSAMREFFGVMASHGLKRGTYATTSRFTPEALAFANANGINAQDGDGLLKLIATRTPEQQAALLATAFEGEYWRPTCASCGVKMVEPRGQKFWGCPNFRARGCTNRIYKTAAATVV